MYIRKHISAKIFEVPTLLKLKPGTDKKTMYSLKHVFINYADFDKKYFGT